MGKSWDGYGCKLMVTHPIPGGGHARSCLACLSRVNNITLRHQVSLGLMAANNAVHAHFSFVEDH